MNTTIPPISALHTDAASGLQYRLRTSVGAQPDACVLLLHGLGSHERDLADLGAAFPPTVQVVLPRAPLAIGPEQYAWFRVDFTAQGPRIVADEAEASRQRVLTLLASLQRNFGILPQRTLIGGFSQGGILSASVSLSTPEAVAGFALLSGRILPELEPLFASPQRLAPLKAFIAHGQFDSKLPVHWAEAADQLLQRLGVAHTSLRYPADHQLTPAMQADFLSWAHTLLSRESRTMGL